MFWAKQSKVCFPSVFAFPSFISSCDVEMAVGVQAVMDLVLEVSLVTAQQSPPSARPSDCHPWPAQDCLSAAPVTCPPAPIWELETAALELSAGRSQALGAGACQHSLYFD